jgi:hypothetical protein
MPTEEKEVKALDAWNEPAFIESVAAEGFPGSSVHTDEGFRYHLNRFASGGAVRSAKKEEPEEEPEKRSHHKKER